MTPRSLSDTGCRSCRIGRCCRPHAETERCRTVGRLRTEQEWSNTPSRAEWPSAPIGRLAPRRPGTPLIRTPPSLEPERHQRAQEDESDVPHWAAEAGPVDAGCATGG